MFNFHKPRTYRSTEGCCICKAKSSSSRFIDSRKYERDAMQCFDLKYPRQGEICNACVLLVKRFKRLPAGSKRNWSHIVDAKAGIGPGYNKMQTKYKSERINLKALAQQQQEYVSASSSTNNSSVNGVSSSALSSLCFIPEKFSKIFKKSKKFKDNSKRKIANYGWSQNNINSLPITSDSLDSDYEDTRLHGAISGNTGSTVVQFQTQTRASAYKAQAAAEAKMKIIKLGTKRRKCVAPRKYCRPVIYEESLQFFDEEEWHERKSCCGMFYECASLAGAVLIDAANYTPCEQHRKHRLTCQEEKPEIVAINSINNDQKNSTGLPLTKPVIHAMPAAVQLQPLQASPLSSTMPSPTHPIININITNSNYKTTTAPTPVLKKHHLFFKRQSECFPQGDMVTTSTSNGANSTTSHETNVIKTESEQHQNPLHHNQQQQHLQQQLGTTLQRHIENAIISNSANPPTTVLTNSLTSLTLSISVASSSFVASSATISSMPLMSKHSLAKVATISPPLMSSIPQNTSNNSTLPLAKPSSFLHKIKPDSGKIVKHSLDKFNAATNLKTSDISEMKPIIRTVDKPYILSKPPTQGSIASLNAITTATTSYQSLASYNATTQPPLITAPLSAASPTSSTSSTSSTKFSDNSSDSGFDENMLDRKSASPLQEDCEKKIVSRPGVQTMFLASGVQIHGQSQNVILNGNEAIAKIVQNRKYSTTTTSAITPNPRSFTSNHHPPTTAVKIAQISTTPATSASSVSCIISPPISMSSAAQAKMRAIYNNNNTIQHENGITTIVPASSLAASNQTAAMQNIAPSTVTITPAPPVGTQFNTQNVLSRKIPTANIINLQSNATNLGNSQNSSNTLHHHLNSSNNNHNTTNQKIILLKASNNTATASANYTITGGGRGEHLSSSGSGR